MRNVGSNTSALVGGFAALVLVILSGTPLYVSFFALFLGPVTRDLGWDMATFPQGMLVYSLTFALASPLAGRMSDRVGASPALSLGFVLTTCGLIGLSLMGGSVTQLVGCSVLLGLGGSMVGATTLARRIAGYFEKRRGVAMGIIFGAGPMLAAGALSPVLSSVIADFGWRPAYRCMAVVCAVVSLLMVLLLKTAPPGQATAAEMPPMAGAETGADEGIGGVVRQRNFWLILVVSVLLTVIFGGASGHLVAIATEGGASAAFGAQMLSTAFLAGVAGPVLAGMAADWLGSPRAFLPFLLAPVLGFLMLLLKVDGPLLIVGSGLIGLGFSAWSGQTPLLVTRYFGLHSTGLISGVVFATGGVFLGLGPVVIGFLRTGFGDYQFALMLCAGLQALAAVLVALLGPFAGFAGRSQAPAHPGVAAKPASSANVSH